MSDVFTPKYAGRAARMTQSEVRALFAVAARPDVISLAGGMPFVQALPGEEVLSVVQQVLRDRAWIALQYGAGSGQEGLKVRLAELMAEEGAPVKPETVSRWARGLQRPRGGRRYMGAFAEVLGLSEDEKMLLALAYVGLLREQRE